MGNGNIACVIGAIQWVVGLLHSLCPQAQRILICLFSLPAIPRHTKKYHHAEKHADVTGLPPIPSDQALRLNAALLQSNAYYLTFHRCLNLFLFMH